MQQRYCFRSGDRLIQQVQEQTEEQKRRRLMMEQMKQSVSPQGYGG